MTTYDRHSQNRHILSMLGVVCWVDKAQATKPLVSVADRLVNPRISHLLPAKNPATDSLPKPQTQSKAAIYPKSYSPNVQDIKAQDVSTQNVGVTISNAHQETSSLPTPSIVQPKDELAFVPQALPNKPLPASFKVAVPIAMPVATAVPEQSLDLAKPPETPAIITPIHYHVQGVRFGQWVLVVDRAMMDIPACALWSSLLAALQTKSNQAGVPYGDHQVQYPLIKNDSQHQSALLAKQVFAGFLLRLMGVGSPLKLVYLTSLADTINCPPSAHVLPTIDEMIANPKLKKKLWQTLMAD